MSAPTDRPSVVVIGGGLAGITAALDCADGGAGVTLLEQRLRLGGATWSFERDGMSIDNGQHVFLRCCTAYRRFLDRIGSADKVHLQDRLDLPVLAPGGRQATLRRTSMPAPLHLGRTLAMYGHLGVLDRVRLVRGALALRAVDRTAPAVDARSFGRWLREHGQSDAAIDALWGLICLPTVNLRPDDASLAMAATVFQIGLLERADAGDIGWARVPLGVLHGDAGTHALQRAGVEVVTGSAVQEVKAHADHGFTVTTGERVDRCDAVVLAVPHDRVGPLLPAGSGVDAERCSALGWSAVVDVHLVYDRRVMSHAFAAAVRSPVQYVFDRTGSSGVAAGQYLAISLSGADDILGVSNAALIEEHDRAIRDLFPAAPGAQLVDALVTKERKATFRATPGSGSARPGARTAVTGLALAGAWTATGWPATMEGAVRSGHAAASVALAAAGLGRRLPKEVTA
jgi:squalene-associated FAD-dependent desaturase